MAITASVPSPITNPPPPLLGFTRRLYRVSVLRHAGPGVSTA
jgi:hypothetical protein